MKDKTYTRYSGPLKATAGNTSPYPVSRLAPIFDLVDLAQEISQADELVTSHAHAKLDLIAGQIRRLQEDAYRILQQAQRDQSLHHVACNFRKQVGDVYHLYERGNGQRYFSRLSPAEWGTPPHAYLGSYRLENDQTWTALQQEE